MNLLKTLVARRVWFVLTLGLVLSGCGGGGSSSGGSGGNGGGGTTTVPSAPTSLAATAGNQQIVLTWTASSGATSYHVKRGTATGGPYTQIGTPTAATFTDTGLTNGTAYFYVVTAVNSAGESGNSNEATSTPVAPVAPSAPTGLSATAGNQQIVLTWTASGGATSYHVKRGTATGGPYTQVGAPTAVTFTDTGLTNGTAYFYVVSALNGSAESANSTEASATPAGPSTSIHVTVDPLTDRHAISPYVYGGSYPKDAAHITDSGMTIVRWGGNATSTYNWQLHTYNADNDYFFEDFNAQGLSDGTNGDSAQFIQTVKTAGGNPLMTMVMLPWVAQSQETSTQQGNGSNNDHWSYSVVKYGAQCHVDQFNNDAGNGVQAGANCDSNPVFLTAHPDEAYFPLLDQPGGSDPANSVYRNQWAAALATAFGSAPHFYDMDNEIDIWQGTHRDIHPNATSYNELRDIFLSESRALKGWDPQAITLGPVSCCWFFYWRSAAGGNDTPSHGGVDFLPWWLNEVYWSDKVAGARSLDIFDIHAYPDGPDTTGFTTAQQQALSTRVFRDWWDPTYTSEASYIQNGGFSIEPVDSKPFRIPRMRAVVNTNYPGTPIAITEWNAEFAGAPDFSNALSDADAYGILGRERVYLSSRWEAPDPANPNYQTLKLYRNYDGQHHTFESISVSATHDADKNLFSTYAAVNAAGTSMTLMVVNKDPQNTAQVQFSLGAFTPATVAKYTLSSANPTSIVTTASAAWSSNMTFAPYSATLLVISGTTAQEPNAEWDLNPDTIMVPAGGSVTLQPAITSNSGTITLGAPQFDPGITLSVTQSSVATSQQGAVTASAASGTTPGFYHFTIPGTDGGGVAQTQGGWIFVTKPAATLSETGDNQSGAVNTTLNLSVTLAPGSSGGTANGASILFTTDAGSLSARIVTTDSTGKASVVLTLPSSSGPVHVTAEGPYGLGHPVATFTETAN